METIEKESDMIPGLVIHDLPRDVWKRMRHAYSGWAVVSEKQPIHPCIGCFGCWNKTPGQCVVKDGYEKMGALIHHAREVVVISRYTYGGFSGFVKNVFDRSLGYVLPQFEIINGESHHQKRYENHRTEEIPARSEGSDYSSDRYGNHRPVYPPVCRRTAFPGDPMDGNL